MGKRRSNFIGILTKRRCLSMTLLLVAGAVVNVVVAWACATSLNVTQGGVHFGKQSVREGIWRIVGYTRAGAIFVYGELQPHVPAQHGYSIIGERNANEVVPTWSDLQPHSKPSEVAAGMPLALPPTRNFPAATIVGEPVSAVDGRGWPLTSMWCRRSMASAIHRNAGSIEVIMAEVAVSNAIKTDLPLFDGPERVSRVLPLKLAWPGFAINTAFYAAILWLLFAAPFALRRRRRVNGGLCPKCAYPVGTSDVCTECGAALRPIPTKREGVRARTPRS